jgi:CDGSH-type Zn-finger protein/truncated hemoglobin YjbI
MESRRSQPRRLVDDGASTIASLRHEAAAVAHDFGTAEQAWVAERLARSVIRPLAAVPGISDHSGKRPAGTGALEHRLVELARRATKLRLEEAPAVGLLEATAALHDLVAVLAPDRLPALAHLQAKLPTTITVVANGPYLATNAQLNDWLGVPLPARPQLALCRCGASKLKPLCDGSHVEAHFVDTKDPKRVADRRDTYAGTQVTVFDNRGLCAHSGFCTDRLNTVFHAEGEPFVTPSGGRMDEIVSAVRGCPSGALSFGIDGREAREYVDQEREPAIEVSKDGPCRCGKSQNKPFCSGMHWYANFHDPQPPADREPTLFEWAGGFPALLRMTRIFYGRHVPEDPLLAPLFANMSPDHPERVAAWLGEVFGGPPAYSERYGGYTRMLSEEQRARWVQLICRSADDAFLPDDAEFRAALVAYIEWGSRLAKENSTPGATPPPDMPMPRWWWVCDAYPDARRSALAPLATSEEPVVTLPSADEPVGFAAHIKPLFRDGDRRSMRFAFDLWSHDDVATHAAAILERLEAGSMPCDGAWPEERIAVFARWVASGKAT